MRTSLEFTRVIRAALPAIILWSLVVALALFGRQPGALCITPLAWLLALMGGVLYARPIVYAGSRPAIAPLALIGLLIGVFMAVSWLLVSSTVVPANAPAIEIEKQRNLDIGVSVASLVFCTLLAIVGGKATRAPKGK